MNHLVIEYKGITPTTKHMSFAVCADNKSDLISFVLDDLSVANYTPYLKIQNISGSYIDKIPLSEGIVSDNRLLVNYYLKRKSTIYKQLLLQLQFEDIHEDVVWQTEIVEISLSNTIPADQVIPDKYPSIITLLQLEDEHLQEQIDETNEQLADKQDVLVSGTNIKTVNNQSILGEGNIEIESGVVWGEITGNIQDQTDLQNALDLKADKVGPLPSFSVSESDGISDFLLGGEVLINKSIILNVDGEIYFALFDINNTTLIYRLESCFDNRIFDGKIENFSEASIFEDLFDGTYLNRYELQSNKVTSITSESTDTEYPSAKAVYDFANLIETTYSELKSLRDNSQLIPGRFYRITDYVTTTIQENTDSAYHLFDIIVLALSNNKLSEEAYAIQHEGNTYFANSKLEAWQLWYCLDNDTNRFAWALDGQAITNLNSVYSQGRALIRQPSFDGEIPAEEYSEYRYAWGVEEDVEDDDSANFIYSKNATLSNGETVYNANEQELQTVEVVEGKGVIYRMIDEFNNDCPYDFKNILFTKSGSYTNAYTFSYTEDSTIKDASLLASKGCYDNIIKERISLNKQQLNFNVFYSSSSSFSCYSNTFGDNCYSNTFGDECYSNTFGNNCQYNTFGDNCYSNTFGNICYSNTFGNICHSNTFGNICNYNTFGDNCYSNTFGKGCYSNTFGNICYSNTFGTTCQYNTFGTYCSSNTFESDCRYNTFGDSSSTIRYCRYNILDNGCQYLYINTTGTASSSNQLQNIHIHLGVKGTSSSNRKTITVDRNLSYTTDVYPVGSTEMFI